MKGKLNLYYDEEGDFLEINMGSFTEGYFKNLGQGIFERVDAKTSQITGLAIMGFKQRTKNKQDVTISLPMELQITAQT